MKTEPAAVLEGQLVEPVADADRVQELAGELRRLRETLSDYVQGVRPVRREDTKLLATVDELRRLLETIFQQRITFKGEDRPPSGTPLVLGQVEVLLFTLGHQLASLHPALFRPDRLEVVVRQRVGTIEAGGQVAGITVEDLHVSSFYRTALAVEQEAKTVAGTLEGVSIQRIVAEPRALEVARRLGEDWPKRTSGEIAQALAGVGALETLEPGLMTVEVLIAAAESCASSGDEPGHGRGSSISARGWRL